MAKTNMKISVKVTDVSKKMFLRQELATAKLPDGTDVELCIIIGSGALHIKINKKAYVIELNDLLEALLEKVGVKAE